MTPSVLEEGGDSGRGRAISLQRGPLFAPCTLKGDRCPHGGPQNATSSLSEGVREVFTIDTELGEETRVPHLHILRAAMSSWVAGESGYSLGTPPRNVCRNV